MAFLSNAIFWSGVIPAISSRSAAFDTDEDSAIGPGPGVGVVDRFGGGALDAILECLSSYLKGILPEETQKEGQNLKFFH